MADRYLIDTVLGRPLKTIDEVKAVSTEQGVVQMSVGEVVVDEMTWYLICFLCPLEFFDRWVRVEFG